MATSKLLTSAKALKTSNMQDSTSKGILPPPPKKNTIKNFVKDVDSHIDYSFIVPCYNEAASLHAFSEELYSVLKELHKIYGLNFEIIFINDGSRDNTLEILYDLRDRGLENLAPKIEAQDYISIEIINFSRNFGKEAGIYAGLEHSLGHCIILDADLQHPIYLVKEMIAMHKKGLQMICARCVTRKGQGRIRAFLSEVFYKICNMLSDVDILSGVNDFRLLDRLVVGEVLNIKEYHRFSKAIFEFVGFEKAYLEYEFIPSPYKNRSSWSFFGLFKYAIEGIVSFSTTPLKVSFVIGMMLSGLSFCYGIYSIFNKLILDSAPSGWTSIIALICFIGGLQLIILGIMGEYIARIYEQVKNRPIYIINPKDSKK